MVDPEIMPPQYVDYHAKLGHSKSNYVSIGMKSP